MTNRMIISVSALILLLVSCGPSKQKTSARIDNLEKRLYGNEAFSFDKVKADSLLALYETYINEFPDDTLTPGYVFKAANLAMNSNDGNKAVQLFDLLITKYPSHSKAGISLFFKGFVFENLLGKIDNARETYLLFIEKYPNDEFADDARMAVENLGKTPDQLIREFEAKKRADSARIADSLALAKKAGKKRK